MRDKWNVVHKTPEWYFNVFPSWHTSVNHLNCLRFVRIRIQSHGERACIGNWQTTADFRERNKRPTKIDENRFSTFRTNLNTLDHVRRRPVMRQLAGVFWSENLQ